MRQPSDDGAPTPPRRRRVRERNQERVYVAALSLFSRQGYADTSVAQIAEHAGIGRGTFFNYFPRKDCLISAWSQERMHKLTCRLTPHLESATDAVEALRACMSTLGDLNEEEPELSAAMVTAWIQSGHLFDGRSRLGSVFALIIEEGRARGEIRSAASSEQLGEALRDLYFGALHRWAHPVPDGRRRRLHAELQLSLSLLLHGLTAPAPPEPLSAYERNHLEC
ncbi:TetR/AcrR family transcriptional regulator [Streptomyces sp. NPDC051909]|uniref:TetR/AcrR family transcriptional regulator n=1 Tax=Streptomyces sp. NPDC051909 TaxID=3154944 RepID=UPI003442A9C5